MPYILEVNFPYMQYLEVDLNFSLDYKNTADPALHAFVHSTKMHGACRILDSVHFLLHLCAHLYKEATTYPWVQMGRDMSLYKFCDLYLLLYTYTPVSYTHLDVYKRQEAKRAGIHTCVETSGAGVQKDLLSLLPYTDLLYYDYKLTDPKAHLFYTGADLQQILENLSAAADTGVPMVLRCPIIPGINMEYAHYIGIARTASETGAIREIHLQPYHSLGEGKAVQLGIKQIYKGKAPADAEMELARETVVSALKQDIPVMIL